MTQSLLWGVIPDKYPCCMNCMDVCVFQYFDMSLFWHLTTVRYVDTFLDLLFDHDVGRPDQYQDLLKQITRPDGLCAQYFSPGREDAAERLQSRCRLPNGLTQVLHRILFSSLVGLVKRLLLQLQSHVVYFSMLCQHAWFINVYITAYTAQTNCNSILQPFTNPNSNGFKRPYLEYILSEHPYVSSPVGEV